MKRRSRRRGIVRSMRTGKRKNEDTREESTKCFQGGFATET
jgi:hypothetical protein